MKHSIRQQLSFVEPIIPHEHAQELKMVSKILNNCPTIAELVCADLFCELADPKSGRDGVMSAEQVYKALTVKQMNSFSYDELAFHLLDSKTYRPFCAFGFGDEVSSSFTLQRGIKKIHPETLKSVNRIVIKYAREKGIETGRTFVWMYRSRVEHSSSYRFLPSGRLRARSCPD